MGDEECIKGEWIGEDGKWEGVHQAELKTIQSEIARMWKHCDSKACTSNHSLVQEIILQRGTRHGPIIIKLMSVVLDGADITKS